MGEELHQQVRERTEQHEEQLEESWDKPGVNLNRLLHPQDQAEHPLKDEAAAASLRGVKMAGQTKTTTKGGPAHIATAALAQTLGTPHQGTAARS